MPVTRSLSIHADYRCRHSGACCTADWPIRLDERLRQPLALAQAEDRLPRAIRVSEATTVLPQNDGACVFYDRLGTGLCTIQSTMGADAMPVSCRHFPRVALLEPRGVSIRRAAEAIERWTPAGGDLSAHVRAVFARLAAIGRPPANRDGPHARVIKRYLAAKLFASWVPYRADGLTSLIDALDDAHALLRGEISRRSANPAHLTRHDLLESIRATDFKIVHGTAA